MDKNIKAESLTENYKQSKKSSKNIALKKIDLKSLDLRFDKFIDDEDEILIILSELSRELLVSSDGIAEDSYCQLLIKKLIDLFDQFSHNPEISLNAILCLNAFLDLNPLVSHDLRIQRNIIEKPDRPRIVYVLD